MRRIKPRAKHHVFTAVDGGDEITLVGHGRNAYLWVGWHQLPDKKDSRAFTGATGLRALARAILREIPAPKRCNL